MTPRLRRNGITPVTIANTISSSVARIVASWGLVNFTSPGTALEWPVWVSVRITLPLVTYTSRAMLACPRHDAPIVLHPHSVNILLGECDATDASCVPITRTGGLGGPSLANGCYRSHSAAQSVRSVAWTIKKSWRLPRTSKRPQRFDRWLYRARLWRNVSSISSYVAISQTPGK